MKTLAEGTQEALLRGLRSIAAHIGRQYDPKIVRIHRDNERGLQSRYNEWFDIAGIEDEPTAPYTSAQNCPAGRSGGMIAATAWAMQIDSNLPPDLWSEFWAAAVYLYNLPPSESRNWKSRFGRLQIWMQENDRHTGYQDPKPDITHLRAYGCRAYPLTKQAIQGFQRRALKTKAHAKIGYLVGYDSTNISAPHTSAQNGPAEKSGGISAAKA